MDCIVRECAPVVLALGVQLGKYIFATVAPDRLEEVDIFHLKWKSHNLGGAPDVAIITVLAINHACSLSLGRDDGVTIVRDMGKLQIDTTWIDESPGDSHEQGLARGLNLVVVFEVHPDSQEINTNAPLAIPEVPRGRDKDGEPDGEVVPNAFWL